MKIIEQMLHNVFDDCLISWRKESDSLNDYLVINLDEEPNDYDKDYIKNYLINHYSEVVILENHCSQEADFQLRVYFY